MPARAVLLAAFAALVMSFGCDRRSAHPELLRLVDVVPADVEVGDQIEILGIQLPASDARSARVTFEGDLFRPGLAPLRDQTLVFEGASLSIDRVVLVVDESLQAQFCGHGDNAVHTTFRGRVTVNVPGVVPGVEVFGTIGGDERDIVLDVAPRSVGTKARRQAEEATARALQFLGLKVQRDAATSGLVVESVRPGGPAAVAGLSPSDRLVAFDGVTLLDVTDLNPSGHERSPRFDVVREGRPPFQVPVSLDGYRSSVGSDLVGSVVILGGLLALLLLGASPLSSVMSWLERRTADRLRRRRARGPRARVGASAWSDALSSLLKDDLAPRAADQLLYRLAPYLVFLGVSATFVAMPFGHYLVAADVDIGVLFLVSATSLLVVALLTGGYASSSRWSVWGSLRSTLQIISCELPSLIALACVVVQTGSLGAEEIVAHQIGGGAGVLERGAWPWHWHAFQSPFAFLLVVASFASALIEGNRAVFDLSEADTQSAGRRPNAGLRYLFFFFAEWAHIFVSCGLVGVLFLGGWALPGVAPHVQSQSFGLQLLGALLFLAKSWTLIGIFVWVRWTVPRLSASAMTSLCWKYAIPLSLVTAAAAIGLERSRAEPAGLLALRYLTFGVFVLFVGVLPLRVRARLGDEKNPAHLRAFL